MEAARAAGPAPAEVRRGLLGLAVPVYLELLSGVVAGVIDTLWVSRLGAAAVGAVAVATTLENVLLGVILLANIGTTVVLAERLGGRRAQTLPVVRAAGVLWLAITPVVAVGGFLARERIAALFADGGGELYVHTVEFLAVSLPGIAVFFAQNVVDGIFKGAGDTRTPMRSAILANALILLLDPLLIHGLAGLPQLGVQGAAVATVLGRAVALAVALLLLRRLLLRRLPPGGVRAERGGTGAALRRVLAVGLPASGDFVLRMGIAVALVGVVARFGEAPLAAYGIGTKVILFATMACYAVRQAASILLARTGTDVGPRAAAGALIGRQALLLASAVAAGAGAVLVLDALCGDPLLRLFTDDPEVIGEGRVLLVFLALYLVALAGVVSLGGVFMGGGLAGAMFWITLTGAVVQIPLAYGLGTVPVLGVRGVWLSMVLGTAAQYALSYALFRRRFPRPLRPVGRE